MRTPGVEPGPLAGQDPKDRSSPCLGVTGLAELGLADVLRAYR
jgi:hypothetical protein